MHTWLRTLLLFCFAVERPINYCEDLLFYNHLNTIIHHLWIFFLPLYVNVMSKVYAPRNKKCAVSCVLPIWLKGPSNFEKPHSESPWGAQMPHTIHNPGLSLYVYFHINIQHTTMFILIFELWNNSLKKLRICSVLWKCNGVENLIFQYVCTLMASDNVHCDNEKKCLNQMLPVTTVKVSDSCFLSFSA